MWEKLNGRGDKKVTAIALGISVVLNVALAIRCLIWKRGANGLVVYMKKKGYTPPTKEETAECIRESFYKLK